jgi:quercetin dioxygenase-like cupin family protein
MAFWTHYADRQAATHAHDFDEYLICAHGQYTVTLPNEAVVLRAGEELLIPAGTPPGGSCLAGTRTIHAFGGRRVERKG